MLPLWWWFTHLSRDNLGGSATDMQVEKMKLEREKFEFERELEEDKIIAMDLSTMAFEEQQYFQYRKNKILERHLNI